MKDCKIEQRMRCYCAVTVGAAAAVAGAGVSAYSAYSQGQQAKKAGEQASAGNSDLYGSKVEPVPYKDRIGTPESYSRAVMPEVLGNVRQTLPDIFRIASRVNATNEGIRKTRTGGAFQDTIMQEGANLQAMEKGFVPKDVIDSINRMVAENLGGAFDPGSAGFGGGSAVANDAARRLGLTSLDLMKTGMSMAPSWRSNVDSFIYKPQDVMNDFIMPVAGITAEANNLQMRRDEAEYISANNMARAEAMPDPGAVGSFRDSLLLGSMQNRADANFGNALAGLINAGGAAYKAVQSDFFTPKVVSGVGVGAPTASTVGTGPATSIGYRP